MLLQEEVHFKYHSLNSSPKIYIDLEGTLSDFYRYFAQVNYYDLRRKGFSITEISPEYYRKKAKVRKYIHSHIVNKKIDYWFRIPKTLNGGVLWQGLKNLNPYIFTGVIDNDHTMTLGKIKWCRRKNHLGFKNKDLHRILFNKNRLDYAMNNNCPNILIDDDFDNCLMWEKAGGIAFYYVDHIFVVDKIVKDVKSAVTDQPNIDFLLSWDSKLGRYVF